MLLHPIPGTNRAILADDRIMDWVAARIAGVPMHYRWTEARAIGLVEGGRILAGLVVHNYVAAAGNCELSFAADGAKWATRPSIRALLAYPFEQLALNRVTTMIAARNIRALRLNEKLGFVREGLMRQGAGNDDLVILGLLREETPLWMAFRRTLAENIAA